MSLVRTHRVGGLLCLAALLLALSTGRAADEAPPPPQTEEAGEASDARLEAIGGLSAINAQHTFLLIGVISDAHIKGLYEGRQVRSLMNGVVRQLESLNAMLRKLQKAGLSEEDGDYVEQVILVHGKLQAQARALVNFVDKKGEAEALAFEKSRRAALRQLEALLGIDTPATDEKEKPAASPASEKSDAPPPEKPEP